MSARTITPSAPMPGGPPIDGRAPSRIAARMAHPALAGFQDPVRAWVADSFEAPTPVQTLAWPVLARGESALALAPTGSGKTLAAFLVALDRLLFDPEPAAAGRCRVLYVSPLKALAVDVERNLRVPLAGIVRWAEALGAPYRTPAIAVRTGDTPARERARFVRAPADILITTPESLFLLLTSGARAALRDVETVIVDEVHALVGGKRGAHLALSLERLEAHCGRPLQRVGLSATLRPMDEGARYLAGFADSAPRPVAIVDATAPKALDLRVEVPVEDMARLGEAAPAPGGLPDQGSGGASIWPAMHPLILDLVRAHRSTLIFANSRRLAERLASSLNELAGETVAHAHHGSIAREQREVIEARLKAGDLPALVATSSLELGIDMGAIDLVIHVEAPPSVGTALQRIGRAGHSVGAPSAGVILPKYRGDLLACAALTARMLAGEVEPLAYPRNPLDVLAQQIVAMVAMEDWTVEALERLLRRAAPFADLPRSALDGVLDMLSGRYPSDEFAELRPRITWDRAGRPPDARARGRAASPSPTAARSPTAGSTRSSSRARRPGRAGWASSTRRWCSRAGRARRSPSAPAPGASRRSRTTACSCRRRPASRGRCRSGTATGAGRDARVRPGHRRAGPHAQGRARRRGHGAAHADLTALEPAARNLLAYLDDQEQAAGRRPRRPDASSSSATRTSSATGASACSPRSAAASTPRGRWPIDRAGPRAQRGGPRRPVDRRRHRGPLPRHRGAAARPTRCCPIPTRSSRWCWRRSAPAAAPARPGSAPAGRALRRRASARRRAARCSCRGAGPASGCRSGSSGSARRTCWRWRRATTRSRSSSRRTASACATCSTCPRWSASCATSRPGGSAW